MITHMPSSTTIKAKQTAERDDLEVLYQMVRIIRKSKDIYASLDPIFHRQKDHPMTGYLLLKSRNFSKIETTLPYFKKF
jgi:phenylalanine-4-hydroxylase